MRMLVIEDEPMLAEWLREETHTVDPALKRLAVDDSLTKPFACLDPATRVLALGRRSQPAVPPVLRRASITLDPARGETFRNDRFVPLSKKGFAMLADLPVVKTVPGVRDRNS